MATSAAAPPRIASIDLLRGFVMFLMLFEVTQIDRVARAFPDSSIWRFIGFHTSHVEWFGCSLHDLIQPAFSLLVGAALPFSIARRREGQSPEGPGLWVTGLWVTGLWVHAIWRAFALVMLGVLFRSFGRPSLNWTFEDTLSQIGLGYLALFWLVQQDRRWHWPALAVVLLGYWAAFALYPLPGTGFSYAAVGVPENWPHHLSGLAAHWNKNSNFAWAFDTWFLNQFPRDKEFLFNGGGYSTLSFIPTLGTMILGLIAGHALRETANAATALRSLLRMGAWLFLAGLSADALGVCPIVKRIWTPAWTLYSAGLVLFLLAGFHALADLANRANWLWPLQVIGANSILAYTLAHTAQHPLETLLASWWPMALPLQPLWHGLLILGLFWLTLWLLWQRRVFVRI
jgi:heparan-alpha-glucosaminide N-acetyltransferase